MPGSAVSQVDKVWAQVESAARVARDIVGRRLHDFPDHFLLNVNIPNLPYAEIKPALATRLGKRHQSEAVIRTQDPAGREIYWIGPCGGQKDAGEGTDFHATDRKSVVEGKSVSVRVDLGGRRIIKKKKRTTRDVRRIESKKKLG